MRRSHLMTIGWLVAVVLMLHAAMLAGGSHQMDAHQRTNHESPHAAGYMARATVVTAAPVLTVPVMSDCSLLTVATLRYDAIVTDSHHEQAISAWSGECLSDRSSASPLRTPTRAEFQVYLI